MRKSRRIPQKSAEFLNMKEFLLESLYPEVITCVIEVGISIRVGIGVGIFVGVGLGVGISIWGLSSGCNFSWG
jgi:hypothetical protein